MKRKLTIATLLMALCAPRLGANVDWPEWGVAVLEVGSSADARQEQQALRNSLELVGIPYVATADVKEAVRRSLVLIGGILLNTEMTGPEREILYSYVERGGVLLATQVQGNMFFPLFGLLNSTTSRGNFRMHFSGLEDPLLRYLNRPEERSISLGDPQLYSKTVWSTEYSPGPWTKILARYGNRTVALTVHPYGRGLAYALGLGFKETTLLPQLARSFEAARQWINSFEPSGDVFRLILRGIYEDTVHPFLLVHTVPEGKKTALVLSHDVDAAQSFRNSRAFAQMEASYGVSSTFFITTKYFRDASDVGYYSPRNVRWIQQLKEMGFAVESHSVSHSLTFDEFPVGSPDVNKESYQPAYPTVFGEVGVSKQLLDHDLHQETRGFRAGYLRYPSELLRVLEDSGYLFDSSVSAQYVLTNFPYFGFRRRTLGAEQSNIVVVPVTLDDSRDFLTQETQEHALRTWLDVIHANSENGAITCLLIHPTDTTYKLETERRLIEALRGSNTWIGDVGSLARFWRSRAQLRPVVGKGRDGETLVILNLSREELPSGLAVVVESTSAEPSPQVVDTEGHPISVSAHESGDRVLIRLP